MPSLGQFGIDRIESLMWRRRGSSAGGITVMWVVWGVTRRVWVRGGCWCGCSLSCFSCRRAGENVRQNSSIYVSKRVVFNAFSTHRGSGRVVKASRSKSLSIEVRDPVLGRRFESCLSRNHFFFFFCFEQSQRGRRQRSPGGPMQPSLQAAGRQPPTFDRIAHIKISRYPFSAASKRVPATQGQGKS